MGCIQHTFKYLKLLVILQATDVEAAIKGLMDGTLDPKDIRIEGIESEEEAREKEVIWFFC